MHLALSEVLSNASFLIDRAMLHKHTTARQSCTQIHDTCNGFDRRLNEKQNISAGKKAQTIMLQQVTGDRNSPETARHSLADSH